MKVISSILLLCLMACSSRELPRAKKLTPSDGLVLIASMGRTDADIDRPRDVHLVTKKGRVVRSWSINFVPMIVKLDPSGNLMVSGQKTLLPNNKKVAHGIYQHFVVLSPKGEVLWSYENKLKHHDFIRLPNGNISFIVYYPLEAKKIGFKGQREKLSNGKVWPDKIIEVDPNTNKIVWQWKSHKHLDFGQFERHNAYGDLLHTNSIDYISKYFATGRPAYMISAREPNKVYIIDKETKKLLWESPNGLFRLQHDATFTSDSTIMAFSNGTVKSEVIEYDLKQGKVKWRFKGGDHLYDQMQFFSSIVSGAQRLPGGNTLITLGTRGYVLEVDQKNNVVWNYFNDLEPQSMRHAWPYATIFKAKQYPISIISED